MCSWNSIAPTPNLTDLNCPFPKIGVSFDAVIHWHNNAYHTDSVFLQK